MLDLFGGIDDWENFHAFPSGPVPPPLYHPSPRDQAFGRMIRDNWLALAADGRLPASSAWKAVNAAAGWPAHVAVGVLNETAATVVDYKSSECAFWRKAGIGQGFWWTN